jgi:DNA polymerase-3 subunit epsilon
MNKIDNISNKKWDYLKDSMQMEPVVCNNTSEIIVLDCETTGLDIGCYGDDEILEISIINGEGNILLNTLLKPYNKKEWPEAVWIHNITPDMVSKMPYPHEIVPILLGILNTAKVIVGYNVSFDLSVLESIGIKWNGMVDDVMKMFVPIYKKDTGNWRNQKLSTCAAYYNYNFESANHRSLEDVKATLHCYKCINNNVVGHKMSLYDLINKYKDELVGYCERNITDYEALMKKTLNG